MEGTGFAEGYSVGLGQNSCNNGNGWGNGYDWIWILLIFAVFGGWGNGFGNNGGYGGVGENYALATDFATIERKIDGVNNGLCDGFYSTNMNVANGNAAIQQTLSQGFAGLNTGLVTQGYESRLATQGVMSQLASCCCDIKDGISGVNYNLATQASGISREIERGFCNTNFNMAQQNCATLQAIDKVGDRIVDYLTSQENQRLRDEVAQYRDRFNNQYVINEVANQVNPCAKPAYVVPNPNCCYGANVTFGSPYGNSGCGCM